MTHSQTPQTIGRWIGESITEPRQFMRKLMTIEIARAYQWQMLIVAGILGVLVNHFSYVLTFDFNVKPRTELEELIFQNALTMINNPYVHAMIYISVMVIACFATFWVARIFGGTGEFGPGILGIAWVALITAGFGAVQLFLVLLSPLLANLLGLATIIIAFRMLTNFIAELHGFTSPFQVFIMIIVTGIAFVMGTSVLLWIFAVLFLGILP